jgi:hypothetical protein
MNRRAILAAVSTLAPLLVWHDTQAQQREPASAEILFGPVVASSPSGERFWLIATSAGAFPIPDYALIVQLPRPQFEAIVLACGEWVMIDGEPHHWNHRLSQWEMAIL